MNKEETEISKDIYLRAYDLFLLEKVNCIVDGIVKIMEEENDKFI